MFSQRDRQVALCSGMRSFISLIGTDSSPMSSSKKSRVSCSYVAILAAGRFFDFAIAKSSFSSSVVAFFVS